MPSHLRHNKFSVIRVSGKNAGSSRVPDFFWLLKNETNNPDHLAMAADLELSLYLSQRSDLNHLSNKRTLTPLRASVGGGGR
jgi:hypothetical protein